jgi:hypothetical protein
MAQPHYSLTLTDYEGTPGDVQVNTGLVTALTLPGLLTQIGALRTAIDNITIGIPAKENQTVFDTILSQDKPTDPNAQRGNKWLVIYHDNTQFFDAPVNAIPNAGYLKPFRIMIPTADNSLLADNEKDLDLTVNPGLAFKTAFEAIAKSPYGGSVVIDSMEQTNVNA